MIINITCPNCNFSKQVPSEKIPAGIKNAKCPRCAKTFEIPVISEDQPVSMEKLPEEPLKQETPPPLSDKITDVTAEPVNEYTSPIQEDYGYFAELWRVFSGVLFSPTEFFRGVKEAALKEALIFGVLTGSMGLMFSLFWEFLFISQDGSYITKLFPQINSINNFFMGIAICSPLIVLISALVRTLVVHASLSMLGGASRGFEGTFKVMLYSNAASVFSLIPYIGGVIVFIWSIAIIVTGIREIHETSNGKAVSALILPVIILFFFMVVATFYLASKLV